MEFAEEESVNLQEPQKKNSDTRNTALKAGAFIFGLSLIGGVTAGVYASKLAKRKSQQYYKDLNIEPKIMPENPTMLALRALAWATFYSVGAFSIVIFATCKWYGIGSIDDLRTKMRSFIKRRHTSEGRTEFENLSDFIKYLEDTYSKPKEQKEEKEL